MRGQEERDVLFARLFGLQSILRSGILFRDSTSGLEDWQEVVIELEEVGDKKAWLRESCGWVVLDALDKVVASDATWKEEAIASFVKRTFGADANQSGWTPEKVALTIKLQALRPVSTT